MSKVLVATYGSLRKRMENFVVNKMADAKFVGTGTTCEKYDLFRYGGAYFPSVSLVHSKSDKPVVVDVFETTEDGLNGPYDRLEGYPGFYNRTMVDVCLDGEVVKAWMYHIDEDQGDENRVTDGDWCTHKRPDYYGEADD